MNHISIHSKITISMTALMILTCWNGSMVDSNSKDKRPDVNFYGTLQDHVSREPADIEDILIGGKYKQILVYQMIAPSTALTSSSLSSSSSNSTSDKKLEMDPKQNKTLLDLDEVTSIKLAHPDKPIEHEIAINNHKYSEIIVTLINGSTNHYLIESTRDLSCVKIDKGTNNNAQSILEERKLNMIHVKELIIKGKKSAKDVNSSRIRNEMNDTDKAQVAQKTEEILDEIEKNVKDLPQNDPSQYEKLKTSIISLLRSLRDQLQKMLSMIKN